MSCLGAAGSRLSMASKPQTIGGVACRSARLTDIVRLLSCGGRAKEQHGVAEAPACAHHVALC